MLIVGSPAFECILVGGGVIMCRCFLMAKLGIIYAFMFKCDIYLFL